MSETKSTKKKKRHKISVRLPVSDLNFIARAAAIDLTSVNKFAIKAMLRLAGDTIREEAERRNGGGK